MSDNPTVVIPRRVSEGAVPLISIAGDAVDCGRQYAGIVMERYPGYRRFLDRLDSFLALDGPSREVIEDKAPHMFDVIRGMREVAGPAEKPPESYPNAGGCTSFAVHGGLTLDGGPITGQTKDTHWRSAELYIVLRMRIAGAPTIFILCYPGELTGYGMWSTGMAKWGNSLHSMEGGKSGLTPAALAMAGLACETVGEVEELALRHGIRGSGNGLFCDKTGDSVSIEFNVGGVGIVRARDGICVHANHPEAPETAPHEHYPDDAEKENSRFRKQKLWDQLNAERGRLTAQKAMMALADHSRYPMGLCRHVVGGDRDRITSGAVVAEPMKGRLTVTRGQPCCAWPVTYEM